MYNHQKEAIEWSERIKNRKNPKFKKLKGGIMAHAMGLGKTLSSIMIALTSLNDDDHDEGEEGGEDNKKVLFIVPNATLNQWENEFTTRLSISVDTLIISSKSDKKKHSYFGLDGIDEHHFSRSLQVVITTPGQIREEYKAYCKTSIMTTVDGLPREDGKTENIFCEFKLDAAKKTMNTDNPPLFFGTQWDQIFVDEAHHYVNHQTEGFKSLMVLQKYTNYIWCITGTPYVNRPNDIINLLRLVSDDHYNNEWIDGGAKTRYFNLVSQAIHLRSKDIIDLPELSIIQSHVNMRDDELSMYRQCVNELGSNLRFYSMNKKDSAAKSQVLSSLTKVGQTLVHPKLSIGRENFLDWLDDVMTNELYSREDRIGMLESSKLKNIFDILTNDLEGQTVIFSQWTSVLELIASYLELMNFVSIDIYHGGQTQSTRQKILDEFGRGEFKVLLVSLKSGGCGLNLQCAQNIIKVDYWWNNAIEEQANMRVHRIGQTKHVKIFELRARIEGLDIYSTYEGYIKSVRDKKLEESYHCVGSTRIPKIAKDKLFDRLSDFIKKNLDYFDQYDKRQKTLEQEQKNTQKNYYSYHVQDKIDFVDNTDLIALNSNPSSSTPSSHPRPLNHPNSKPLVTNHSDTSSSSNTSINNYNTPDVNNNIVDNNNVIVIDDDEFNHDDMIMNDLFDTDMAMNGIFDTDNFIFDCDDFDFYFDDSLFGEINSPPGGVSDGGKIKKTNPKNHPYRQKSPPNKIIQQPL